MSKTSKILFFSLIVLFLSSGCSLWKENPLDTISIKNNINNIANNIENSSFEIRESSTIIQEEADKIRKNTDEISNFLPEKNKSTISPIIKNINDETNSIINQTKKLDYIADNIEKEGKNLHKEEKKITNIGNKIADLEKEKEELLDKINSKTEIMLKWLILICIIGVGISAALVIYGNKMGVVTGIASIATLITAIVVDKLFIYMAWGGLGLILIIVGIVIWHALSDKKSFREIIETVEMAKERLTPQDKNHLFGTKNIKGQIEILQNNNTKNIVKKERKKIKKEL